MTTVLQSGLAQHVLDLGDLIGLLVHRLLGERQAQAMGRGRQQMDPRGRASLREPRSVLPSRAMAASPAEGAVGG